MNALTEYVGEGRRTLLPENTDVKIDTTGNTRHFNKNRIYSK